jgi:hypothetical protein
MSDALGSGPYPSVLQGLPFEVSAPNGQRSWGLGGATPWWGSGPIATCIRVDVNRSWKRALGLGQKMSPDLPTSNSGAGGI